ncbi:MAG: C40 family peptidase [Candidatus Jorgensenbacteria bacterium]
MTDAQKIKIVALARSLIGKPYKYGAAPEEAPEHFDCSSFIQYIFKQIRIELPRSSILQADCGEAVDFENREPGDLLFFRGTQGFYNARFPQGIGHVALYLGGGKIIHATSRRIQEQPRVVEKGQVKEQDLEEVTEKLKPLVVIKRN